MDSVRLLAKRRDRSIAIILRFKEQEVDAFLPVETSNRLRKMVLDQLNAFCDTAVDILTSEESGNGTPNQVYLDRIDEIYAFVTALDVDDG